MVFSECHLITVSSMAHKNLPYRFASFSVHEVTEYVTVINNNKYTIFAYHIFGINGLNCKLLQLADFPLIAFHRHV
ncbi:hypothetical protein ALC62_14940 [Cyphomyrmex costatus]|uniref:Uncharacterized protein n=1 Tax=Cyphomyrmex costatus TaxID=456900 RepID=A0A195C0X8_9HYME|nr:hypothetical protein ALC62_14940 [Cyphomyrmex costatus]